MNPNGYADGSLDPAQFAWLQATVAAATGKAVMVFSHHTSATMDNPFVATGGDPNPRVLGAEVTAFLLSQQRVVAWVNGHTHRNEIIAHKRADGSGGFWEINTAAHIDYPQQARMVEVADNTDNTLSIFTTIVDHAGPADYRGDLELDGRPGEPGPRALGQRPAGKAGRDRGREGPQHRAAGAQAVRHGLSGGRLAQPGLFSLGRARTAPEAC